MPRPRSHLSATLLRLSRVAGEGAEARGDFHVRRSARDEVGLDDAFFSVRGDVVFADLASAQRFASAIQRARPASRQSALQASHLNAMGLIHEVFHVVIARYRASVPGDVFGGLITALRADSGADVGRTLRAFVETFPPPSVYRAEQTVDAWLASTTDGVANERWALEEMLLAWLANENPAYAPISALVSDADLRATTGYGAVIAATRRFFEEQPRFGPGRESLVDMLLAPMRHAPNSLLGQLAYMRDAWGLDLELLQRLLLATDFVREEGKWFLRTGHGKGDDSPAPPMFRGEYYDAEPERFSADRDWMPRVVMIAKSTFVWLDQLSKQYGRWIRTLAEIPDEELDALAARGFTGLWLIGIWKRSAASLRIKQRMGNSDAVASAYSLADYEIAPELGGWEAYGSLRDRARRRGIRLASDMVPNHMGIDSRWVIEHPDWFVQSREPPFPNYSFNGPDLCDDGRVGVLLEDGYWSTSDAAVVFKRFDKQSGDVRYIYHGNDGTSMPWNDTAQLDYTKAEVREAVIQTILHVARLFPIIRFDAAMTLAKRHYQRLWFPVPGSGGDIPSRAAFAMTRERFDELFPIEFWREVVDRVAAEVPDTLLLAEAFWMMEGYFVRTLGMHRVYNSAFMHMMKKEENANYRSSIKNVLLFNPQILKRHVNFMNNPDEETAIAQFGRDDKYFGVCTVMCTMPGLPMFGHGQLEGFCEKYGMEYKRPRWDEQPDVDLVRRHEREIFPLLHLRALFSDVESFFLYDLFTDAGHVDEDVFCYSNRRGDARALVVYHNKYKETRGWIRTSVGYLDGAGNTVQRTLGEGLSLSRGDDAFTIFRDHASGLEHLQGSRELCEQGLYVELGAFKYHVFLEFREVTHGEKTPYRDLARALGRRGVPSVERALVEHTFGPLREALVRAISGEALDPAFVAGPERAALERRLARAKGDPEERWIRAWALADALRAEFEAAHLGEPIARAFREAGEDDASAREAAALVRVALSIPGEAEPAPTIARLLDEADTRALLGVNVHQGVEWLRKEPYEALVRALSAIDRTEHETVDESAATLVALAAKAGYRVDRVRERLASLVRAPSAAPRRPS